MKITFYYSCLNNLENANVFIGKSICSIQNITDSQIICVLNNNTAGNYLVLVQTKSSGYSNANISFQYPLLVTGLSNNAGS